jgi:Popeye-like protein
MNWINSNYFIHAANILLLLAYSIRDILWLRLFALASSLIAIPYFLLQPTPLWAPLIWSVFFASINVFQSWRLLIERRPVKLTEEEEQVRQLIFRGLAAGKVLQVLSIGSWATLEPGTRLLEVGIPADAISLIINGRVRVMRRGQVLGEMTAGDIVGSALILSGAPSDVEATAIQLVRVLRWQVDTLERYLGANPETRTVMQRYLARDLATKLERSLASSATK